MIDFKYMSLPDIYSNYLMHWNKNALKLYVYWAENTTKQNKKKTQMSLDSLLFFFFCAIT